MSIHTLYKGGNHMAKAKKPAKWDFEGWATRYGVKCRDGETIAHGAFSNMDGTMVPLVDDHARGYDQYLDAILGRAYLEHRDEGVYSYITFNPKYKKARLRREQVEHGDIQKLSIKANALVRKAGQIVGGVINDLSIVSAGANPGAFIQQTVLQHGDGYTEVLEDEAVICFGDDVADGIEHGDEEEADIDIAGVWGTMTEEQQAAALCVAAALVEGPTDEEEDDSDSDDDDEYDDDDDDDDEYDDDDDDSDSDDDEDDEEDLDHGDYDDTITHGDHKNKQNGGTNMKANQFTKNGETITHGDEDSGAYIAVADFIDSVRRTNSFKAACIEHGVTNVTDLYDQPTAVNPEPLIVNTPQGWVKSILGGVKKVPFTKIKSLWSDLSAFEGDHRASGYPVLGEQKRDEQISILNRITDCGWIYKRQTLDRDVLYQITSFNFLQWLQSEMGMMLNQELARAILISDGRLSNDPYKIKEDRIRPIAFDSDVWTITQNMAANKTADELLDQLIEMRSAYQGSGDPTLFVSGEQTSKWLVAKDSMGRRLYGGKSDIAELLSCTAVVEVPQISVAKNAAGNNVKAIMVNMADYALSMPTGDAALKDSRFDIDVNKEVYLLEWLCGGALITPKSALVLTQTPAT